MLMVFSVLAASGSSTEASSVVPMTLATMSDHAGQVIVGEVTQVRSYWAESPRRIETEVTFQNVEYLKGSLPDSSSIFRLIVPGGTVGEMRMQVCGAPTFAVGEKWVLFLLPTYKTFPVVGLHQGEMRVYRDVDGEERVGNAFHMPIDGVDSQGFIRVAGQRPGELPHPHARAEHGVRLKEVAPRAGVPARGMTYEEFLATVQPLLDRSKDHHLTEPAGRRILVRYSAVPLKPSAMQQAVNGSRYGNASESPSSPSSEPRGTGGSRQLKAVTRISSEREREEVPR